MQRIEIIGAGVTGMCAALRLTELLGASGPEIEILEKEHYAGGLLQSTVRDGYCWDNGAFMFRGNNLLRQLLPQEFHEEQCVAEVVLNGTIQPFPPSFAQWMRSRSLLGLTSTAMDFLLCYTRRYLGLAESNLHDWLRYRLTAAFLDYAQLEPYLLKLQGRTPRELSSELGMLRLRGIDTKSRPMIVARGSLRSLLRKRRQTTSVATVYPNGPGVEAISRALACLCKARAINIRCGAEVKRIVRKNDATFSIEYGQGGQVKSCDASGVVSTMPLNELPAILEPPVSAQCLARARELAFMDLRLVFFGVACPVIRHRHMALYSFDKHHCWKRLVARSLPAGVCQVMVEVTYDPRLGEPADGIVDAVKRDLTEELHLFRPHEIVAEHTTIIRNAYPIHELGYSARRAQVLEDLETPRFRSTGRTGGFAYLDTSDAARCGFDAATRIAKCIGG